MILFRVISPSPSWNCPVLTHKTFLFNQFSTKWLLFFAQWPEMRLIWLWVLAFFCCSVDHLPSFALALIIDLIIRRMHNFNSSNSRVRDPPPEGRTPRSVGPPGVQGCKMTEEEDLPFAKWCYFLFPVFSCFFSSTDSFNLCSFEKNWLQSNNPRANCSLTKLTN